jgi:hypothetical protein
MKKMILFLLVTMLLCCAWPALSETVTPTDTPEPTVTPTVSMTPDEMLQQWYQLGDLLRANGTYPFMVLSKGDQGYEVKALQTRLAELGYYNKEVVDNFGKGTYNAMRLFEKANSLKVDGIASVEDQKVLYGSEAVASKSSKTTSSTDDTQASATSSND